MIRVPRPLCKHGVTPGVVETEIAEYNAGGYMAATPVRTTLIYDCPTPRECAAEAYRTTPFPQDG